MDRLVISIRELAIAGSDVGIVVSGKRSAYVERVDDPFLREVKKYYVDLDLLPDLLAVEPTDYETPSPAYVLAVPDHGVAVDPVVPSRFPEAAEFEKVDPVPVAQVPAPVPVAPVLVATALTTK